MRKFALILFLLSGIFLISCRSPMRQGDNRQGTLHIIHAGSLTYPLKEISEAFQKENPGVRILTEAWGSKAGARRVMELDTPCDLYFSADYVVIENMLIPDHASWYISFAANEMAIVYTESSRYAGEINRDNWYEIMLRPDVRIGRSNPDHDPCGVRSVFTGKLAELYYEEEGLASRLLNKDVHNIRPKETDLIALLESGHADYIFLYRSVARQHKLPYLELPPELHQGDAGLASWYASVSTQTLGRRPGEQITEFGQPMVYGLTIPHKAVNIELAERFLHSLLHESKGLQILESLGQPVVVPTENPYHDAIPNNLRQYVKPVREVTNDMH